MAKYLNLSGLTTFWNKIKSFVAAGVTGNAPGVSKTVTGYSGGKFTYGSIAIEKSQVTGLTAALAGKMDTVSGTAQGQIAVFNDGSAVGSGLTLADTKST